MIYFIVCSVIWGLTWIAIKYQFHSLDSSAAVFYRFLFASVLLFIYAKIKKFPLLFSKEAHAYFAAQGFFMFSLNYILSYWASELAPSALVALAFTSIIFFNMFGARLFLKIPIEQKVFWGAFLSICGMGFISVNELSGTNLHTTSIWGFLLSGLATLSASAGNLISMQSRKHKVPITSNNAWGMLYGSILTLLFCLFQHKSFAIQNVDTSFVVSFLYLSIFGTIISFGAYLKLIEIAGPSKAAFTSVVSPIIAIAISMYVENLTLTLYLALGVVFCLIGNIVALAKIKKYAD